MRVSAYGEWRAQERHCSALSALTGAHREARQSGLGAGARQWVLHGLESAGRLTSATLALLDLVKQLDVRLRIVASDCENARREDSWVLKRLLGSARLADSALCG